MEFRELQFVLTISKELSFSRAAKKLFVSQPTLSLTVAKLEQEIGYKLFDRTSTRLKLTEKGKLFAKKAESVLEIKNRTDREIQSMAMSSRDSIHFGISDLFSGILLPRVLSAFYALNPSSRVIIHNETSSVLETMLLSDELDLALVVKAEGVPNLRYQEVFSEQILLAVSQENQVIEQAENLGGKFPYLAPKLLGQQKYLLSPVGMRSRSSAEAFFAAEGITPFISAITASVDTQNRLASYNHGVAFIPYSFVKSVHLPPNPLYFKTADSLANWTVAIAKRESPGSVNKLTAAFESMLTSVVSERLS